MSPPIGTRRIASDLSALYALERAQAGALVFDVVIVGSGYGGAMAAAELAGLADASGQALSVLVLERGKEYTPGMFPSSLEEVPAHVRVHREKSGHTTGWLDGLFDVRIGGDVCALVGNGLGGGSLINAGVMEAPRWNGVPQMPASITRDLDANYMDAVKARLGARQGGVDNTISLHPRAPGGTAKTNVLRQLATGQAFREAAVTVEFGQGAALAQCTLCGDCMTGCNVGAKKSLDTSLLLQAWERNARVHTGASVIGLKRGRLSRWELTTVFTDESLRGRHDPLPVRARTVIVAAGALGSPELLLRSEAEGLRFSPRLGQQFSCNGDNILAVRNSGRPTNSVAASEDVPLTARSIGPTITGVIDMPGGATGAGFLVQEFAVPAALKRVFDEIVTTTCLLHHLADADDTVHAGDAGGFDPLAVQPRAMAEVLLLGVVGHDESAGALRLPAHALLESARAAEGNIRIDWPEARKSHLVDDAFRRTRALIEPNLPGGEALPNPLWRLLPDHLDFVFHSERGPLLTVHPMGGCPIGADHLRGVVDEFGRVFDGAAGERPGVAVHPGLLVLDGSILPASLGANPALTIAAVAQRAARQLAQDSHWAPAGPVRAAPPRPRLRSLADCVPPKPAPTTVELIERLWGPITLTGLDCIAELTLQYHPYPLGRLARNMRRELQVTGPKSALRIYSLATWEARGVRFLDERERRTHALLDRPVTGTLSLLQREPSGPFWRKLRGFLAYLLNRGLRDAWSNWREVMRSQQWGRIFSLAGHAAEVRRYDYDLRVGPAAAGAGEDVALANAVNADSRILGRKRFTYSWHGNPWTQLMELELTAFPGKSPLRRPVLKLDGRFMARFGVPLVRIKQQQNQVVALAEMASFLLYLARMFVSIHLWSFRAPDPMAPRTPKLLPGRIDGMAVDGVAVEPQVIEIGLEPPRQGKAVTVRLTRYQRGTGKPPLVMIHGYSASGTTFTHNDIPEPMARYFWNKGRDVWILDLRTSAGMPSAILPWNFEDAALADIPVAIERILAVTGAPQVDVFAHCIGAVMLSMALLTDPDDAYQMQEIDEVEPADGVMPLRYLDQVRRLKGRINKIVLSQKGPVPVYSDGNVLRAYLTRVLRSLVLPQNYQFRVDAGQSLAGQGLDRLLSSLPYPRLELLRENPLWPCAKTPWAAFRHRMDALYARDFSLCNISRRTLGALEDLFGPLNLDTVAQAVHFARYNMITNGAGRNCFVSITGMQTRWPTGGTLAIHGEDNGLADIRTLAELSRLMALAPGLKFEARTIEGFGHQDCLIGVGARKAVLDPIEKFLSS